MADIWCRLAVGRPTSTTTDLVLQGSLANQAAQLGSLAALDISFNHFEGAQLCMQAILQQHALYSPLRQAMCRTNASLGFVGYASPSGATATRQ